MTRYSLTGVADDLVVKRLRALVAQDRATTAELLAHIAEVDARRLYLPAAYPSMYQYCRGELRMSEDMACRRINVARAALAYPRIFPAIESGELNVSTVDALAQHLTPLNADELLSAAASKSRREVECLIAERFPQADVATTLTPLAGLSAPARITETFCLPAPGRVEEASSAQIGEAEANTVDEASALPAPSELAGLSAPARIEQARALPAPGRGEQPRPRVAPLAPDRFALQVTVNQHTHDQLRYAQELLGHAVAPGDVAAVLERALDVLVSKLEQKKFAKSARSGPKRGSKNPRHVPADLRRQVWQRDRGQCTFTSTQGKRCEATSRLEFDHIEPLARGGRTVASNLRLRCRAHNQYAAECEFGAGFMDHKREAARRLAATARA